MYVLPYQHRVLRTFNLRVSRQSVQRRRVDRNDTMRGERYKLLLVRESNISRKLQQ